MAQKISDDNLDKVTGGSLPNGWENIADMIAPSYLKQYPNITWEEACEILKTYVSDPSDYEAIKNYMKKYFPDQQ